MAKDGQLIMNTMSYQQDCMNIGPETVMDAVLMVI